MYFHLSPFISIIKNQGCFCSFYSKLLLFSFHSSVSKMSAEIKQVASFLTEEARLAREPWRRDQLRRREQAQAVTARCEADKDLMAEMAKQGLLSAQDVMTMSYVLFDADMEFFSSLLMCASIKESISRHNWMVVESSPACFAERWGPIIEKLPSPLFPADKRFIGLNLKLLSSFETWLAGGSAGAGGSVGGEKSVHQSMFRDDQLANNQTGGYMAPLVADLREPEAAVLQLQSALGSIQERMSRLERATQSRDFTRQPAQFGHSTPQQGRGRGGRGARGGGNFSYDATSKNGAPPPTPPTQQ